MKKIYNRPELHCVELNYNVLLCQSKPDMSIEIKDEEINDAGSVWSNSESKHSSIWD